MAALTTTLNQVFTPLTGDFIVQVTVSPATLQRRNAAGAEWVSLDVFGPGTATNINNPVSGVDYRFLNVGPGTAVVRADQNVPPV